MVKGEVLFTEGEPGDRMYMILEGKVGNAEMMYLHCLRYGMFDTDVPDRPRPGR